MCGVPPRYIYYIPGIVPPCCHPPSSILLHQVQSQSGQYGTVGMLQFHIEEVALAIAHYTYSSSVTSREGQEKGVPYCSIKCKFNPVNTEQLNGAVEYQNAMPQQFHIFNWLHHWKKDLFGPKMPFYAKQILADSVIFFIYNKFHFSVSSLFIK